MEEVTQAPEQVTQEPTQEAVQEAKKDNSVSANIRELRESKERAERERDEALKILRSQQEKQPKKEEPLDTDDDINISPDDLVEGKHLTKYYKKMKALEKQIQQYQKQTTDATAETRLKSEHPDFDKVVNAQTIESLRNAYPHLASTLNASTDLYSKGASAYTLIKKLGIYQDEYGPDKDRALENAAKPKPLSSIDPQQGDSPLSNANAFANGLTEELKIQLRKEMEEARKRR